MRIFGMHNKGVALVITLWVTVLLTVMAAGFARISRDNTRSTSNFKDSVKARLLAVSAYEQALAYLMTDPDLAVDYIDAEGLYHTDEKRTPITGTTEDGRGKVTLSISDEEARMNINQMTQDTLATILANLGVKNEELQPITDCVADWRDSDDLVHLMGAEDDYYEPLGYRPKNTIFDVPEELLLVKGITNALYYGEEGSVGLKHIVTTWGNGLNINTASLETLYALGANPAEVDMVLQARAGGKAYRSIPQSLGNVGRLSSQHYRIEVTASQPGSPQGVRITAIVLRNGNRMKPLYWKEELATIGS